MEKLYKLVYIKDRDKNMILFLNDTYNTNRKFRKIYWYLQLK